MVFSLSLGTVLLLTLCAQSGWALPVELQDGAMVSGKFYLVDSATGDQTRGSRRHLNDVSNAQAQKFRLDLGSETFDMELSQRSVWAEGAKVIARRSDDEVEEVAVNIDNNCFLSGQLTSHDGVVSINRCERMTGMMEANGMSFELNEDLDRPNNDEGDSEMAELQVNVQRRSYDLDSLNDEELVYLEEKINNTDSANVEETTIASTSTPEEEQYEQRAVTKVTVEIGLFLDSNFANYMKRRTKHNTEEKLTNWLIMKWNAVQGVYGDIKKVGVEFVIELKHVEVWWTNPGAYGKLKDSDTLSIHLKTFCQRAPKTLDFDHKHLYTRDTGNHAMGLAYVDGICDDLIKCGLSKSQTDSVRIEIHELGHNLGFRHEPDMQPCELPAGFMGWDDTYRFQDCYRKMLVKKVQTRAKRCMTQKNVDAPVLSKGSSSTSNSKTKNRNRNRNKTCQG